MSSNSIRLVIVDDHLLVRHGLRQLLSAVPDIEIVGEAEDGEAGLRLCGALKPDLVLMDVRMPGMGGLAATAAIRKHHPAVRIIGLSTFAEDETETAMIVSGAQCHLSKAATLDELTSAIRRVHGGETIRRKRSAGAPGQGPAISGQQRRVLALMTKGFTNAEIAKYLNFSIATAGYHVSAILTKLEVSNRVEAAAMAIREGLVSADDL